MESPATLIWVVIFGAIGLGYLTYGKRQRAIVPLITGIALCVFPYFLANVYLLVVVGISLTVVPYFFSLLIGGR